MNRLCLGLSVFIALMLVSLSWTHFGISQNLIKSAKSQIIQPQASGDVHIQALLKDGEIQSLGKIIYLDNRTLPDNIFLEIIILNK